MNYDNIDNFQDIFDSMPEHCDPAAKARVRNVVFAAMSRKSNLARKISLAVLSVAAVCTGIVITYTASNPEPASLERIRAAAGHIEAVTLSDSSVIWLKGGSDLIYPEEFCGRQRKVFLSGEIYAEISKDSRHPFIIDMGGSSLEVYGTSFNLKAYPESEFIEVSLLSGAVKTVVRSEDGAMHENSLRPGERLRVSRTNGEFSLASFNPEFFIPFKDKRVFSFDSIPFSEIIARLEEGFGVDITLLSKPDLTERFFAYFPSGESLDEILNQLSPGLKYRVTER